MTIYEDVSTLSWWKKREPKNTDQILLQKDFGFGDRTTEEFSFSNLRSYNVLGVKYSNLLGIVPIAVLSFVRRYFTIVIFSPSRLIWNHLVLVPHLDHSDGRGHLDILPDNGGKYREHGTKDKFTQRRWEWCLSMNNTLTTGKKNNIMQIGKMVKVYVWHLVPYTSTEGMRRSWSHVGDKVSSITLPIILIVICYYHISFIQIACIHFEADLT